jgi:hypothetical protein
MKNKRVINLVAKAMWDAERHNVKYEELQIGFKERLLKLAGAAFKAVCESNIRITYTVKNYQ